MTAGPVNRALLESFYQNPGEIYDDTKTEGAFDVIADQIDDNWGPVSNILGPNGSTYVGSPSITGVTGLFVYQQLLSLKAQIDAIVGGNIPPGTITYDMLAPEPTELATAGVIPVRDANGRFQVASPSVGADVANRTYVDAGILSANTYYAPSDTVIVSLPTERTGTNIVLKKFFIKNAGKYRLKGEYRSSINGNTAGFFVEYGMGPLFGTGFAGSPTFSTASSTYSTFSVDLDFIPENTTINVRVNSTPAVFVRNVTLCGDVILGNQNTFSGVD